MDAAYSLCFEMVFRFEVQCSCYAPFVYPITYNTETLFSADVISTSIVGLSFSFLFFYFLFLCILA